LSCTARPLPFHQLAALARGALARIQRGLLLGFDRHAGRALAVLERVQRPRARQQFGVLLGLLRGVPRGQPVVEGLARGGRIGLGRPAFELGLLQRGLGVALGALGGLDGVAQSIAGGGIHVVVEGQLLLDLGQVAHHRAAQPDQEAGEHKRHQPQAAVHPFFRQSQGIGHAYLRVLNITNTQLTA
jgi:hypothetical protein